MNYKLLLVITIFSFGCSNVGDMSVMSDVTQQELKEMIEYDSLYIDVYEEIQKLNRNANKLDSAKYSIITYKMCLDFYKEALNTERWDSKKEEINKEWDQEYRAYDLKADSIILHWKEKLENESSLDRFLKVEPIGIKTDYYSYSSGIRNAYIRFRLTNLSNKTISGATFKYKIVAKVNDDGNEGDYKPRFDGDYTFGWDWQGCISTSVFNESTTGYWEVPYEYENIVGGETLSSLLSTYNIYVIPYKVRVDNVNYSILEESDIPFEITQYWKYEDENENMSRFYKESIINEYVVLNDTVPYTQVKFEKYFKEAMNKEFPIVSKYVQKLQDLENSNF